MFVVFMFSEAINGIRENFKERSFIIEIVLGSISILFVYVEIFDFLPTIICIMLVLSAEIFNTAIEKTCDFMTSTANEEIRVIKDISAGGVLISAIFSCVVAIYMILSKL